VPVRLAVTESPDKQEKQMFSKTDIVCTI
jgi:hypothetical protein